MRNTNTAILLILALTACSESSTTSGTGSGTETQTETTGNATTRIDITDTIFTSKAPGCADYINDYFSSVIDMQLSTEFSGELSISVNNGECLIETNAIPNHNFNVNGNFATPVSAQSNTFRITQNPSPASTTENLALGESAIFLNGVKLDILPAACYGVGNESLGNEKIGCGQDQIDNPWRYDPMSPLNNFGTDDNNAHTQPNGAYHYHGNPMAMFTTDCESTMTVSPVIGFAADGYPIFGSCFDDNGTVRKALSSYILKNSGGSRQDISGYTTPQAGQGVVNSSDHDGQFRGDWEYSDGAGDLDECNGMTVDGNYGYYVTDTFPWVMNCYKGTRNSNFSS